MTFEYLKCRDQFASITIIYQARVQGEGGGAKWPGPPPPRKWKKKGHQSKFEAISPICCYFFSRKFNFLSYFLSWAPPWKIEKQKKKKKKRLSDFGPSPLTNSWTRACLQIIVIYLENSLFFLIMITNMCPFRGSVGFKYIIYKYDMHYATI